MNLYQWLCLLGVQGVIVAILSIVVNKIAKKVEKNTEQNRIETGAIKEGVKALLRDRLLQGYKHYINDVGFADESDRGNMENIYKQFKYLKGNGDMKDLRKTFRRLPFVEGGVPTEVADDDEH